MTSLLVTLSCRGVRSLNPTNFRAPWPFVKKGAYGQRKIGPNVHEKIKWPGPNREFPELSPKWNKENPKELHRYTGVQEEGYFDPVSGKFVIVPELQAELVVPDLAGFKMSETTALMILADGAEEMEVVITVDVLRRAGIKVIVAGLLGTESVKCSRGIVIIPDDALSEVKGKIFNAVVLPGGQPGSTTLASNEMVGAILKAHHDEGRIIAAICAAPIALKAHSIPAQLITSHPSVRKQLEEAGYNYSEESVVVSDSIITSRGPGTAFDFALKLVDLLVGKDKASELVSPMMLKH